MYTADLVHVDQCQKTYNVEKLDVRIKVVL